MDKTLVVILTKNREKLFDQTIRSLHMNTPRELFDVLVIDDGSEDTKFLNILKETGEIDYLILSKTGSLGFNKNIGAEYARFLGYKYVYQSDNDMYFLPEWLHMSVSILEKFPRIKIVGPYCHPYLQKNQDTDGLRGLHFVTVDAINGNSMLMRTNDWCNYKMLETQGIMASEDWEMCQRVRFPILSTDPNYKAQNYCVKFKENLVLHCGITNSKGEPATGADLMIEELSKAKIKYNLDIYYE